MRLVPKPGESPTWYQMPFAIVVGLYRLFVQRKSVD